MGIQKKYLNQDIDRCLKTSNWNANRIHQYYLLKYNGLMECNLFEDWFSSYFFHHGNYTVFNWNELFDHTCINEMIQEEVLPRGRITPDDTRWDDSTKIKIRRC